MQRSGLSLVLARLGFVLLLVLAVPLTALAVLFSGPLEPLRRAKAEQLLSDAIDLEVAVNGPIQISFGWEPAITISKIEAAESDTPTDVKALSADWLSLKVPILPLLVGSVQLNSLVIDGLKVDIEIPPDADSPEDDADEAIDTGKVVRDFVRSRFASDLELRNAELNYNNRETGFVIRYAFNEISSSLSGAGGVQVEGRGKINDEPLTLDGKIDPEGAVEDQRSFEFSASQAGLTSALVGTYTLADPADSIDATVTGRAPYLDRFLAVYGVKGNLEGSGDLSARLSGPLDSMKLRDLSLKLAFETGDTLQLSGNVANVVTGDGLDLTLAGSLAKRPQQDSFVQFYDLGVQGFSGRIAGSIDEVLVRDLHVITTSVSAQLRDIGPVTAERLYKDPDGRLGLYDVLVLACDPARPCLRVTGTIKDIISLEGVDLKGAVDFLTADFLDLAAEDKAPLLGHITGNVEVSDADGSLGIEQFAAKVTGSSLLALSVNLAFDDLPHASDLKFDTHLDIPSFRAFAAALGSEVEDLGRVGFDGTVTGGTARISSAGTALVGTTTIAGTLNGGFAQGRPVLSGDIATALLHLSDVLKLKSINSVYQANVDDKDVDVFDYSKVWETLLVDLQIKVARIAGGGDGASNIQGRVTYLAGMVGLDPVTMTFLGGRASVNGKIDTRGAVNAFALKGRVDNLRIGAVLKELEVSYPVSGALQVSYDLTGAGNTAAQIPRSLDGSLSMSLRNGTLGTSLLDLAGVSLPQWLLTSAGRSANVVCLVAPMTFDRGKGTTRAMVMETNEVQVVGVGFIDFRQSEVNLRFKPQALRPQFLKIAQPFAVRGPISNPRLVLTGSPVAGAVAEVLAFPFNLLETIVFPAPNQPGRVPCRVIQSAQRAGGPLGLGIIGPNSPVRKPPKLFGPASPLPLGILNQPLFGGQKKR